jgi:hypothetical protein
MSFTPRPICLRENILRQSLYVRVDEPQSRSSCSEAEKKSLPCRDSNPGTPVSSPRASQYNDRHWPYTTECDRAGILIARLILVQTFL